MKVTTPLELQHGVSVRLTEEQRLAFMQDYEISDRLSDVQYLSILDDNYPKSLLDELGMNSPTVLSYRGNAALLSKNKVGFSGSGRCRIKVWGLQLI